MQLCVGIGDLYARLELGGVCKMEQTQSVCARLARFVCPYQCMHVLNEGLSLFVPHSDQERKKEQFKYGVFFDDDYDYLQHLRERRTSVELVAVPPSSLGKVHTLKWCIDACMCVCVCVALVNLPIT